MGSPTVPSLIYSPGPIQGWELAPVFGYPGQGYQPPPSSALVSALPSAFGVFSPKICPNVGLLETLISLRHFLAMSLALLFTFCSTIVLKLLINFEHRILYFYFAPCPLPLLSPYQITLNCLLLQEILYACKHVCRYALVFTSTGLFWI